MAFILTLLGMEKRVMFPTVLQCRHILCWNVNLSVLMRHASEHTLAQM